MISRFSRYVPSSVHELGLEPFYSSGDGNCFYNSLSILMCGHEHESEIYRLGAALYGLGHYEHIVEAVRIYMYLTGVDIYAMHQLGCDDLWGYICQGTHTDSRRICKIPIFSFNCDVILTKCTSFLQVNGMSKLFNIQTLNAVVFPAAIIVNSEYTKN